MTLHLTPLKAIPDVEEGDDLGRILLDALDPAGISLQDSDVLVLAQKIVSKAEGRLVHLPDVVVSDEALALAHQTEKEPALVQLILDESHEILRARPGLIIAEHRLGFICANAGIDHSNLGKDESWVLLLPKNPDASAARIRESLEAATNARLAVLIIDSHGRPWRVGAVGMTIGVSGLPAVVDKRGDFDRYGRELRVTLVGASDELAAAASLVMGQADEGVPAVHVRGFPYPLRESSLAELIRSRESDFFR
jgi:coenzyme F420-0:L-glutamate ligase / coenzyme F420-1:gamma-L-glutamate ligase